MSNELTATARFQLFVMKTLMLESDLSRLEKDGISIGHSSTLKIAEIVDTDLFESDIMMGARRMADFYILYYCIENGIRRLIAERLNERYGGDWWQLKVPQGVREDVRKLQEMERDTPMSIRSDD